MDKNELRSKSDNADDMFDIETNDRSRLQSLQPLEYTSCALTDGALEEPCIKAQRAYNYMVTIHEGANTSTEVRINYKSLSLDPFNRFLREMPLEQKFSFISDNSHITSEDMIINENIDFLTGSSCEKISSSVSPEYTYTITDNSSVFNTFNWKSGLLKSLPQSQNASCFLDLKSYETLDPCFANERMDLKEEIEKMETQGGLFTEKDQGTQSETRKDDYCAETIEKEEEAAKIEFESNNSRCSCDSCRIM